jgi:branched-chain amino acid transport system ATP-binding protein
VGNKVDLMPDSLDGKSPAGASMIEQQTSRDDEQCRPVLRISEVTTGYTDVPVIRRVSIELYRRELVALLGSNGSGKTTVLRSAMGFLPAWEGTVMLGDINLTNRPVHERVKNGLCMVPAGRRLFAGLSVKENLLVGGYLDWGQRGLQSRMADVFDLFPDLAKRSDHLAGELSGGEQQMCAIGRALMSRPKILLVDELSMGLAPVVVDRLMPTLERLCDEWDIPILFVEQDVQRAIELADRVYVLDHGAIVLEGQPRVLKDDRRVIQAFLGV